MKKYLLLVAALFVGTLCFTSCSDDDDEKVDYEQLLKDIEDGIIKPTVTFDEKENTMSLIGKYKALTVRNVATFDEDKRCESFKEYYECASKELADLLGERMGLTRVKIETPTERVDDKTIVRDLSMIYVGGPYNKVRRKVLDNMVRLTVDEDELDLIEDYYDGQELPETDLTEKGNTMALTINYKDFLTVTYAATFGSDILCQSFTRTLTFVNKYVADYYWLYISAGIKGLGPFSTRKGNSIVQDLTDELGYKGDPYNGIKKELMDKKNDADGGDFLDYYLDLDNIATQW